MTIADHVQDIMGQPLRNKDAAFTAAERAALGLRGLLPWRVATLEQQVALELEHLRRKPDNLEKYIGLAALQDRNETLYYRLLRDHLAELAPIVYTPTVGDACRRFSHIVRRPRGVWITPDDRGCMPELLRNAGRADIRLIVATDNERILGLGDLGAGGMGIPVGKLALYSAGAGVNPRMTLPVSLDCGTDNEELLSDPLYLGYPRPRLRGAAYDAYIDEFVDAVTEVFPGAVLQWEDFKQHNAIQLLDRYARRLPSFNDDIQGTAAVVLGGLLAALRARGGEPLAGQRLVFLGAGAAGLGIARLAATLMRREDPGVDLHQAIVMLDSRGLIYADRDHVTSDKVPFALTRRAMTRFGFDPGVRYDLPDVIRRVAPTILIGTCAVSGAFTEEAITEMAARVRAPIVLPISNPTAKAEASPADVLRWTGGRALVATGSPFPPVEFRGRTHRVGQANNVFVFPGIGLGLIAAGARTVTEAMFIAAARTLAAMAPDSAMYPELDKLRQVSRAIAIAVAREARDSGVSQLAPDADVGAAVDATIWEPQYDRA